MKSKAIIFTAKQTVTIGDVEIPPPRKHEIQVRSKYSTISAGTEACILRDLYTWYPWKFPCVAGYQRSGIVTAVGPEVSGWQVGDRAVTQGGTWSNPEVSSIFGAHLAVANASVEFTYHLPDEVDEIDASSAVVAQVGYNAATRAVFEAGDWVLVYGDGLVGQCTAQAARTKGAHVIIVGQRPDRLELAMRHSADKVINGAEQDVTTTVRRIVGAETVPVVVDSVQTLESQKQYVDLVEPRHGQIVYNGFSTDECWANLTLLQRRELTTHFASGCTRERLEATLALMASGRMSTRPLITHVVPYSHGPEMYRWILEGGEPFLGITLDWGRAE